MDKHLETGYKDYIVIVTKKQISIKCLDGYILIHNNVCTDNANIFHSL